jgi:hypothetical protein
MTPTILILPILSHGIDVSKNKPHNGINFSQGIDSVELMPEPVFVNIYGAQEMIPRYRFRPPM